MNLSLRREIWCDAEVPSANLLVELCQVKPLYYVHFTSLAILARLLLWDCRGSYLVPHDAKVDFDVVRDVLRYFTRNPQAADTVEGVARWRLLDETIHSNLEQVAKAVAWLVSQGLLVEESTSPATAIVRLNQEQLGQIEGFLQEARPGKARKPPPKKKKKRSSKRRR